MVLLDCFSPYLEYKGTIDSRKNFALRFRKFPVINGTAFSRISGKENNLAWYTEIFGDFLPGISPLHLIFLPELNGLLIGNSIISRFFGNSQKFSYHLSPFQIVVAMDCTPRLQE